MNINNWANALVAIVGVVHATIALVEIFFWKKRAVHERLGFTDAEAVKAAPIVANAGLYNSFLALGLLISGNLPPHSAGQVRTFLLGCVIIAGIFGAITLKWTTLVLQTLPGVAALIAVLLIV